MPAGNTYVAIATQTLGSAAASVTFSSIPSTYTDLVLVQSGGFSSPGGDVYIRFNGDSGTNYSITALSGSGTSALSYRESNKAQAIVDSYGYPSTGISTRILNIMNYANSTTYKTFLSRANNAATGLDAIVGLWRSTAAINSLTLTGGGGSSLFDTGTVVSLYGIAAA